MSCSDRAVFLDRDGVINRKAPAGGYITKLADFHLLPGVLESLAELYRAKYRLFIVTNQRGIARGLLAERDVAETHAFLLAEAGRAGAKIEQIYVCPHDYSDHCGCRKPQPGMLLQAAGEHGLTLSHCWMIGDSRSDIEAGRLAGCRTVYLGADDCPQADARAIDLAHAVHLLVQDSVASRDRKNVSAL